MDTNTFDGARLERDVLARIPLAVAMKVRVADYREEGLVLSAPFPPNRNHAGIAFGGAIECMATLAGWGLLWLGIAMPDAEIVIHRAETRFVAPLTGSLRSAAKAPPRETWRQFFSTLSRRGRARIDVDATVGDEHHAAGAEFRGRYVVAVPAANTHRPRIPAPE